MAIETKVGGLIKNGSFEQGSGVDAYDWVQEAYGPTYDAYTRRESANHVSGSWSIFTYSVGSDGWARATSDAFTLRAKQLIYYYRVQYSNAYSAKFQLLDAGDDSLLTEDAFTGSTALPWTKRTFDVSAYIGQSVKVRVWATTTQHGNGCKINWDFIREDIPSWVHKCVCDLGRERLYLDESLALKESLPTIERQLTLEEAIALKDVSSVPFGPDGVFEEAIALKDISNVPACPDIILQEALAFKESLTEISRALLLEEAIALKESLPLIRREVPPLEEAIAFIESLPLIHRELPPFEEAIALKPEIHAEALLFKIDKSGNITYMGTLDGGAF